MKALVLEGIRDLQLRDIPAPQPDGFHVLLKVASVGICGSDIHHYWKSGTPVGLVLGHELTGTVVDPGASELAVGDLVVFNEFDPCMECRYCQRGMSQICPQIWQESPGLAEGFNGGYAELCKVKPHRVYKLPDGVSADEGALVEPLSIAYHATRDKGAVTSDTRTVLVSGGGTIGVFSALMARLHGARRVVLSEVDTARLEHAKHYSFVDEVLDARSPDFADRIEEASGGLGYDTIIESSGNRMALESTVGAIAPGGRYVNVGMNMDFTLPAVAFGMKEALYTGSSLFRNEEFEEVVRMMGTGVFKELLPYTSAISLSEAQDAMHRATSGDCNVVKFIINPN